MIAGHADRSGPEDYNYQLGHRRADADQDLHDRPRDPARRGSPRESFGETMPRVPTADGVRELQNRRVEVTYGPGSGSANRAITGSRTGQRSALFLCRVWQQCRTNSVCIAARNA